MRSGRKYHDSARDLSDNPRHIIKAPETEKQSLYGAVEACGGRWSDELVEGVTHFMTTHEVYILVFCSLRSSFLIAESPRIR